MAPRRHLAADPLSRGAPAKQLEADSGNHLLNTRPGRQPQPGALVSVGHWANVTQISATGARDPTSHAERGSPGRWGREGQQG